MTNSWIKRIEKTYKGAAGALALCAVVFAASRCTWPGVFAAIEVEAELSDPTIEGAKVRLVNIDGDVYAANGRIFLKAAGESAWEELTDLEASGGSCREFGAYAGGTNPMLLLMFTDADWNYESLVAYDTVTKTASSVSTDNITGEPCAVYADSGAACVYLMTRELGSGNNIYSYYMYKWTGEDSISASALYSASETSEDSDTARVRSALYTGSDDLFLTKTNIYKGGSSVHSLSKGACLVKGDNAIYAIDRSPKIYYSIDGGASWTESDVSISQVCKNGEHDVACYVKEGAVSSASQAMILYGRELAGYYEIWLDSNGVPTANREPGSVEDSTVATGTPYTWYVNSVEQETVNAVYFVPFDTADYAVYAFVLDGYGDGNCLWGYTADGQEWNRE